MDTTETKRLMEEKVKRVSNHITQVYESYFNNLTFSRLLKLKCGIGINLKSDARFFKEHPLKLSENQTEQTDNQAVRKLETSRK